MSTPPTSTAVSSTLYEVFLFILTFFHSDLKNGELYQFITEQISIRKGEDDWATLLMEVLQTLPEAVSNYSSLIRWKTHNCSNERCEYSFNETFQTTRYFLKLGLHEDKPLDTLFAGLNKTIREPCQFCNIGVMKSTRSFTAGEIILLVNKHSGILLNFNYILQNSNCVVGERSYKPRGAVFAYNRDEQLRTIDFGDSVDGKDIQESLKNTDCLTAPIHVYMIIMAKSESG